MTEGTNSVLVITPQGYASDPDCKAIADRLMEECNYDPRLVLEIRVREDRYEFVVLTSRTSTKWRTETVPRL